MTPEMRRSGRQAMLAGALIAGAVMATVRAGGLSLAQSTFWCGIGAGLLVTVLVATRRIPLHGRSPRQTAIAGASGAALAASFALFAYGFPRMRLYEAVLLIAVTCFLLAISEGLMRARKCGFALLFRTGLCIFMGLGFLIYRPDPGDAAGSAAIVAACVAASLCIAAAGLSGRSNMAAAGSSCALSLVVGGGAFLIAAGDAVAPDLVWPLISLASGAALFLGMVFLTTFAEANGHRVSIMLGLAGAMTLTLLVLVAWDVQANARHIPAIVLTLAAGLVLGRTYQRHSEPARQAAVRNVFE